MISLNLHSIRERDIDLLLIKLLSTNKEVEQYFLKRLDLDKYRIASIYQSLINQHGETHIVLICRKYKKTVLVHIENIFDIEKQTKSYEEFVLECEKEAKATNIDDYKICLICSDKYIKKISDAKKYSYHISYESLLWFLRRNKVNLFDKKLLQSAIKFSRRQDMDKIDRISIFTNDFFDFLDCNFSNESNIKYNRLSNYGDRYHYIFKTNIKKVTIFYNPRHGNVEIYLSKFVPNQEQIVSFILNKIGSLNVIKIGESTKIRFDVKRIDFEKRFDEQFFEVKEAVELILKLNSILNEFDNEK